MGNRRECNGDMEKLTSVSIQARRLLLLAALNVPLC